MTNRIGFQGRPLSGRYTGKPFVPRTRFRPAQMVPMANHPLADLNVVLSPLAYSWFYHLVDLAGEEVGWLASCERIGNTIRVEEVFLTHQRVSGATTHIDGDAVATLTNKLLDTRPDGLEVANKIRLWGHSHVHMAVVPSPQDDQTMEELDEGEGGPEYFVRVICNKRGDIAVDVWLYEDRLRVLDVPWSTESLEIDRTLRRRIREMLRSYSKPMGIINYFFPKSTSYAAQIAAEPPVGQRAVPVFAPATAPAVPVIQPAPGPPEDVKSPTETTNETPDQKV